MHSNGPSRTNSRAGLYTNGSNNNNNNNGTGQLHVNTRPPLDRMPSSTMSDASSTPTVTNSILNKAASASSSLYQNCRTVLSRLYRVPGFEQNFAHAAHQGSDPVTRVTQLCRLGASLCYVFNQLGLDHVLEVNPNANKSNLKACQKGTAHFVMACKSDLKWNEDDLFAIHELYQDNTNGLVKVVNTITKLLDLLEQNGRLLPPTDVEPEAGPSRPRDERSNRVFEILDSERKYVQDLEVLQNYQSVVQSSGVISKDQTHELFMNINDICDFQRRFLIGVEANASLEPEDQRFGSLFLQMEEQFSCYEPFCANLTAAQDLAIAENAALSRLSHILDPVSELAPLLIKPVQRICKYPLLLKELLKSTPSTWPHYNELKEGLACSERVLARVNEETRRQDNRLAMQDLIRRVEDWKGHDPHQFGNLLLHENFFVMKSDSTREYNVFLFERIILCCRETGSSGKKSSKSSSMLKKPQKKVSTLQLKGRIFINNVTAATSHFTNGQYLLEVRWRGDIGEESFTIKCRNEDLLKQWQSTIQRAVEESPSRRRPQRRSDRTPLSPHSQFPNTPMSELNTSSFFSPPAMNESGTSSYMYASVQPPYPPQSGGFDDEGEDLQDTGFDSVPSTPNLAGKRGPSTRSLPASSRSHSNLEESLHRNRAMTDSTSGPWRDQSPYPSNGRASESQFSLRSSSSSRQLRANASHESTNGSSYASQQAYSRLPINHVNDEELTPRPPIVARQNSQAVMPTQNAPSLKSRAQSSPNMQEQAARQEGAETWSQFPAQLSQHHQPEPRSSSKITNGVAALSISTGNNGANDSGSTLASASSSTSHKKRFSSSSSMGNTTDRSSGTSNQSGPYSATGGLPPLPGQMNRIQHQQQQQSKFSTASSPAGRGLSQAVCLRVQYNDDAFTVAVLSSVTFVDLVEKVLKKIKMCAGSDDRARTASVANLRLRYQDEDGDKILITSEEDVAMALEASRDMMGPSALDEGATPTLTMFASLDG